MPKNLFQDMVKVSHKKESFSIPTRIKKIQSKKPVRALDSVSESKALTEVSIENNFHKDRKGPRYFLWFIAFACILFLFFAISFFFAKAEIRINSQTVDLPLSSPMKASKDGTGDALPFDMIVISGDESREVPVTTEEDVSVKATGRVRIFNNFSTATQKLNIDTKLEGSNKKIYKTVSAVVVPGKNKNGSPGVVEVGIYASVAGPAYNSTPLDFTIVGFKSTLKYTKFDVKSVTKGDITGGFMGKRPVMAGADKTLVIKDLKTSLEAKLLKKATDQIPKGFILFKNAVFLNTDENSVESVLAKDKSNTLSIKLTGTLTGLLFNEKQLTDKIAKENIDKYDGSSIFISNIKDLTFSIQSENTSTLGDAKNITFTLLGSAKVVWKVDVEKLLPELLGKSKKDFINILLSYPSIKSGDLLISPFWQTSIPKKISQIKVTVNYPK